MGLFILHLNAAIMTIINMSMMKRRMIEQNIPLLFTTYAFPSIKPYRIQGRGSLEKCKQ